MRNAKRGHAMTVIRFLALGVFLAAAAGQAVAAETVGEGGTETVIEMAY